MAPTFKVLVKDFSLLYRAGNTPATPVNIATYLQHTGNKTATCRLLTYFSTNENAVFQDIVYKRYPKRQPTAFGIHLVPQEGQECSLDISL